MGWFDVYAKLYDPFMKLFGLYKQDLVIKHLHPKPTERILDIAGGTGYISSKITPKAKEVVVLDKSKRMLNQARGYKRLRLCHAKAQDIPFRDSYFDSVICTDALHHIKEIDRAILEIRRVLKKAGKVVIYEFDIKGFKGFLWWLFEKVYIDNSKFIKPNDLLNKMKKNGFVGKIIRVSDLQYLYVGKKR